VVGREADLDMPRISSRRASTATALALLACMGAAGVADARPAHVKGSRIVDAQGHELKVRGVTWGGSRFVPSDPTQPLGEPDISTANRDFKRIRQLGANLVRVDVSSAAADAAHREAFQRLQRLAKAHGLQLLFANVALDTGDQTAWLRTLAGWFPRSPNVWYLPLTDPDCGVHTATKACGDTESWIWSQSNAIRTLRTAGVRTPIVVNLPDGSRSVSLDWAAVLSDRNLVYGVHPGSDGKRRFTARDGRTLTVSLRGAAAKVPIIFDDVARVQTTVQVSRSGTENATRWTRSSSTTTDTLRWSEGLLDWVTGWTVIDGGDGAIVSGFGTSTRDQMTKGRKRFTTWGRTAAAGYFAVTYRAQAGKDPGTNFPGGFELGDRGPGVRELQSNLARLGYLAPRLVSGSFDSATWQAVTGFQGYQRLERNGIAGAETVALAGRAERPVAHRPEAGRHIEIDLARQVLMLVQSDGRVARIVHISSGLTGNTPVGDYTVTRQELRSWSRPFKSWLPYASYFFEGFAIHEYDDVPEYPASHGCVRVPAADAAAVYDFAELGMPVLLYRT
jgi:peptidoglycan hydrolase-like protein with peptidoglycan-binding domain